MKSFKITYILLFFLLHGCIGNMNPTGGNSSPNYPYFITKYQLKVKNIVVPNGTKLIYEESFFKQGEQDKILNEKNSFFNNMSSAFMLQLMLCSN